MQIADLRQYCATRGWDVYGEYMDTISGTKSSRPGRDRLMKDLRARRVDAVLVWKLDRTA
jgi:site-specific DNA recombinase